MPARAPAPPGGIPGGVLHRLLRLPEREVERVLLERGAFDALALVHLVDVAVRQRAVLGQRAHAEVDVALDHVGVAALDQVADQRDDLVDHRGRLGLVVGAPQLQPVGVGDVCRGHLRRELVGRPPRRARGVVDLVVDVCDVRDEHGLVALVREEAGRAG